MPYETLSVREETKKVCVMSLLILAALPVIAVAGVGLSCEIRKLRRK